MTLLAAGISVPCTVVGVRARRKVPLMGGCRRRVSSMNGDTCEQSSRSCRWSSGRSARVWRPVPKSRAVVSWPAANRLEAIFMTSSTGGSDPSGNVAVASPVITSSRGAARRPRCSG